MNNDAEALRSELQRIHGQAVVVGSEIEGMEERLPLLQSGGEVVEAVGSLNTLILNRRALEAQEKDLEISLRRAEREEATREYDRLQVEIQATRAESPEQKRIYDAALAVWNLHNAKIERLHQDATRARDAAREADKAEQTARRSRSSANAAFVQSVTGGK